MTAPKKQSVQSALLMVSIGAGWLLSPRVVCAQPSVDGDELRVNAATTGAQTSPDVVALDDGSFVVVWGDSTGASVQRFGGEGGRIGGERPASFRGSIGALDPAVAASDAGDLVVAWVEGSRRDNGNWGSNGDLYVQRLTSGGELQGRGLRVEESAFGGHDVAMAPGGEFVVAWVDYYGSVYLQRFDASAHASDGPTRVQEADVEWGRDPTIAIDASGDFTMVWRNSFEGGGLGIVGQRFGREGDPIGERFEISTDRVQPKQSPQVATSPDGAFVVVWGQGQAETQIVGQRFDSNGARVGAQFRVHRDDPGDQLDATVATTGNGSFFVAWASRGRDGSGDGVFGQLFGANGDRVGSLIGINGREVSAPARPAVAMARNGMVLAAWDAPAPDDSGRDVFGRFLARVGGEDSDDDGIENAVDNCPTIANADQADAQGDGYGDACVSPDVVLPPSSSFGRNPVIGRGTTVLDGVSVGDDPSLGERVYLDLHVAIGDRFSAADFVAVGRRTTIGNDVSTGFATRIEGLVKIGSGVTIGDSVLIKRSSAIGDGVTIEPLAIVFANARIGAGATIEMGARVGRGATVRPGAVVPAGTSVPPGVTFP